MDMKSLLVGGGLTLAGLLAGGGIYGLYVKQATKVVYGEVGAYTLMGECAVLTASKPVDPSEAKAFISKVRLEAPHVLPAVVIGGVVSGQKNLGLQVNNVLEQCVSQLQKDVAQ